MAIKLKVGETAALASSWSSASDAIATVDEAGRVTAISPGTVEIYCSVEGVSLATIVVVELPPPPPTSPEPEPTDGDVQS